MCACVCVRSKSCVRPKAMFRIDMPAGFNKCGRIDRRGMGGERERNKKRKEESEGSKKMASISSGGEGGKRGR